MYWKKKVSYDFERCADALTAIYYKVVNYGNCAQEACN